MKSVVLCCLLFANSFSVMAVDLPCWQNANCYSEKQSPINIFTGIIAKRPRWHQELDDITFEMKPNKDYSILWNSSEYRIPVIHSEEANRAVEELAGEVASSVLSPLAYRIPLLVKIDHEKKKFDARLDSAIPEVRGVVYTLSFKPRVDFSRTNPISLEAKFSNGQEIARFVLRLREAEISTPFFKNIHIAGGYSFKDNGWYAQLTGKINFPW